MKYLVGDLPWRPEFVPGEFGVFVTTNRGIWPTSSGALRPMVAWSAPETQSVPDRDARFVHVLAYEYAHGPIPEGHHVHHVDHDKWHNEPANLIAMPCAAHFAWHKLCRDVPRFDLGETSAHVWRAGFDTFRLRLPHQRRSVWAAMALQLPPWLTADFGVSELPSGWTAPAHFAQLPPMVQRIIVSHCRALVARSGLGSGGVSRAGAEAACGAQP